MTDYFKRILNKNNNTKKPTDDPTTQPDNVSIILVHYIEEHIPKQNARLEQWMKLKEKENRRWGSNPYIKQNNTFRIIHHYHIKSSLY